MLVLEGVGAVGASARRQAVAQVGQHVVEVEVRHLGQRPHQQRRPAGVGQAAEQSPGARAARSSGSRKASRLGASSTSRRASRALVLLDGDELCLPVHRGDDVLAGVGDADVETLDLERPLGRRRRRRLGRRSARATVAAG